MYDKDYISGPSFKDLLPSSNNSIKEATDLKEKDEDVVEIERDNSTTSRIDEEAIILLGEAISVSLNKLRAQFYFQGKDEDMVEIERDNSTISPRFKAIYRGKVVLDMIRSVGFFHGGYARVTFVGNKPPGLINTRGDFFSIEQYDWITHFRNNMAIASIDGKLGLIDSEWNIIVPFECERIGNVESGDSHNYDIYKDPFFNYNNTVIPCFIKGKKCFIDVKSRTLLRTSYNVVKKNGLVGIYDEEMSEILPCKYKWAVKINDIEFLLREKDNLIYYNAVTGDYIF